ncbi:solute carrier family 2, facilitated glucose transporter member 1-like isoform X2 [Prorops nasuta]|uniref:solute carrier family 2, facilitated glucose transporter member 1-like isoform X2 n=1 Tax=Prorops nasuta TaxID=863751 RepID=UPI0034CE5750
MAPDTNDSSALCVDLSKITPLSADTEKPNISDDRNKEEPGGWTPLLVLGGATCCIGSAIPAGYNIGVMNNPAHIMQAFCNETMIEQHGVQLNPEWLKIIWSAIVSIFLIGGVTGSLAASWLADKYGRKGALVIGNICGLVGAALLILVKYLSSIESFLLGRLIVGLSGGLATSLLPMYMTEVAPIKLRGAVGVLCQLGITCGVLLGQIAGLDTVLGTKDTWPIMLASFSPLCFLAVIITFALPESPKYLYIIRGKHTKAIRELSRLRNMDIMLLQKEISDLRAEAEIRSSTETWTINRVISDPTVKLPLIIVCLLQFGQQLSGINAVFYYSSSIFIDAGLGIKGSQYATLGTGLVNIGMALVSVPVMSYFNRRTVMLTSCYLSISCLVLLCATISLIHAAPFVPWLCIVTVLLYVLFYGIGLGPIPFFIGSELFDVGPRPAAMALGSVFNWGGNFVVGMMFPTVVGACGPYTFLIFACFTLLLALFVKIFLPETRGRSTMEVASTVTQGFKSRPNGTFINK